MMDDVFEIANRLKNGWKEVLLGGIDNMETYRYVLGQIHGVDRLLRAIEEERKKNATEDEWSD